MLRQTFLLKPFETWLPVGRGGGGRLPRGVRRARQRKQGHRAIIRPLILEP